MYAFYNKNKDKNTQLSGEKKLFTEKETKKKQLEHIENNKW